MKPKAFIAGAALAFSTAALGEPIGRWWSGFGQGNTEYGIKNDSRGSDDIYIACGDHGTYVIFTVGGRNPTAGEHVYVTIGGEELDILTDRDGRLGTKSHVESDQFNFLWGLIRKGQFARVRFAKGGSTVFTLRGASKVLPMQPCETEFERY